MNAIAEFFSKIICINLDKRTDRWESFQKEFGCHVSMKKHVTRFSAIPHSRPFIGFNLSQLGCLKLCSNETGPVLILEDDATLLPGAEEIFAEAIQQLPVNWEVLYLGAMIFSGNFQGEKISRNLVTAKRLVCTHAMAYNVGVPARIYKEYNMPSLYLNKPNIYDCWLSRSIDKRGKAYLINPMISWQDGSYSDLSNQVSVGPNMFELTQKKLPAIHDS